MDESKSPENPKHDSRSDMDGDGLVESNMDEFTNSGDAETFSFAETIAEESEGDDSPIAATLSESQGEEIREGSPFAVDPPTLAFGSDAPVEIVVDGILKYTAMGAVGAAVVVLLFASVAAWWFPEGGTLIAGLGCVLSIFGLYSAHRLTSVGVLAAHLSMFVVSYMRSF